jgi:tetratricopeptide (TPR) repeat protein
MGNYSKASSLYAKALTKSPNRIELRYSYAHSLYKLSKYDKAEVQLRKVLSVDPNFTLAHYNLGNIYFKKAQYYNILTYCWDIMSKNKEEQVLLVCDEAYLMIDTQVPQSLVFLRNIAKRCRKYNGGIVIISHSVVDFLDPSVKMYGQAILDMACYKILMGSDGKNLEEMKVLYKLTEAEIDLIYARQMGVALFMAGTSRLSIKFDIYPYEFDYFSKGM